MWHAKWVLAHDLPMRAHIYGLEPTYDVVDDYNRLLCGKRKREQSSNFIKSRGGKTGFDFLSKRSASSCRTLLKIQRRRMIAGHLPAGDDTTSTFRSRTLLGKKQPIFASVESQDPPSKDNFKMLVPVKTPAASQNFPTSRTNTITGWRDTKEMMSKESLEARQSILKTKLLSVGDRQPKHLMAGPPNSVDFDFMHLHQTAAVGHEV